ncbi:MAG: flagellar hook assembly protein FlgD [Bacteriovoracaceae bacterium]
MPLMGVPDSARVSPGMANIAIAEKVGESPDAPNGTVSKQEYLNKLAGAKDGRSIYKDGKKHNQIGKDEFMKLLSHQMQNQDPMNPMEQTKFVGELAQFAQLEQMTTLNQKFDGMTQNVSAENKFYAASFLGKNIMTQGTSLSHKVEGQGDDIYFKLDSDATKVICRIFDKKNNMVGEVVKDNLSKGSQSIAWDGKNLDGSPATKGDYTVQIFAYDAQMKQFPVESKVSGTVTGVNFENGETVFTVDGAKKVFMRDVDNFSLEAIQAKKSLPQAQMQAMNAYGKQGAQSPVASPAREIALPENLMPSAEVSQGEESEGFDYGDE